MTPLLISSRFLFSMGNMNKQQMPSPDEALKGKNTFFFRTVLVFLSQYVSFGSSSKLWRTISYRIKYSNVSMKPVLATFLWRFPFESQTLVFRFRTIRPILASIMLYELLQECNRIKFIFDYRVFIWIHQNTLFYR